MTFDEIFKETHRRRVGGGPKTIGAEEITFKGNFNGKTFTLRSRVRLRDPQESFRTSAAHRLRDSQVGSAGHWIDLRVIGECADAELLEIQSLAQQTDTRPVFTSRAR